MTLSHRLADTEVAANARGVATAILAHPASLHFTTGTVAVLTTIADKRGPSLGSGERRLLEHAITILRAAELAAAGEPT